MEVEVQSIVFPTLRTKAQAAAILDCSVSTLERIVNRGELPSLKVGKFLKFRDQDLHAYLNKNFTANKNSY